MKTALAIFKRDVRRILKNPVALAVVLGICVVPCLYAWINVAANWDPYKNTSDVPVAVVNNDKAVTMDSIGTVNVGDMMMEALADNDSIKWEFMGEDEALTKVKEGSCYAAIVIPDDFTARLTGVLNGETEKAKLKYYVNEKVNPIAPKVTDTGASTIEHQIDSKFIAKVGEVVAEKLGIVSDKLIEESKSTIGDEVKALDEVHEALTNVDKKLEGLSATIQNGQDVLNNAVNELTPLEGLGTRVSDQLTDVMNRLSDTRANANDLVSNIGDKLGSGASTVSSLSSQANYDVSAIAGAIASAQSQLNSAVTAVENDLTDNEALVAKLTEIRDASVGNIELHEEIERNLSIMIQISDEEAAKLEQLKAIVAKLEGAANEVTALSAQLNEKVQTVTNALQNVRTGTLGTTLLQVHSALDSFAHVGTDLSAAAKLIDPLISQTIILARDLANTLKETNDALAGTRTSLSELTTDIDKLNSELAAIRASQAWSVLESVTKTNPEGVSEFLNAPVELNEIHVFPVANYGSGVAPFFTSLALWVGGIALVAIFKLEVDEEEVGKVRPWQAYFGRWILFVILGVLQAIVCCTGDLIIGIQCAHPWAFYLSAIVASFAFVNIIFALSVAFKHLGKALAFTLVILQVPGSAGMYPIEMMPPFFQAIGPWLPFTYSINAMREAVAGFYGTNLGYNLLCLLLYVAPAILIGVSARGHLVNINGLFDQRLRQTDHLLVSEPVAIEGNHYRLATVVKAMESPREYREELEARSAAFERLYPTLKRNGILALILLPLLLFALMLIIDAKLPTIACFVVALICIYVFLIVVEYYHDRIEHKRTLSELPEEELIKIRRDILREELMPVARIDAIMERREAHQNTGILKTRRLKHKQQGEEQSTPQDEPAEGGDE